MPQQSDDDISSLERARERLYVPQGMMQDIRAPLTKADNSSLPHEWQDTPPPASPSHGARHVRVAGIFFMVALAFFIVSIASVAYFFYYGGNSVSVDKISIDIQGPTTIVGGDTVPLSLVITNKNLVAVDNVIVEVNFPDGTRSATDVLVPYPRYVENIGTIPSGATVTRSIQAVVFGGEAQSLSLPVSLTYSTAGSNATFVKKASYALTISSTPLFVSVNALDETVPGKPFTLTLSVRSNAVTPLSDVIVTGAFPFGFSVVSSSIPLTNSTFYLGTLAPGAQKTITITGSLTGQDKEQRVFHFTVGTAKSSKDHALAVPYMTQDATVAIAAPFIDTSIAINGDTRDSAVVSPGANQNITVSYVNTLATNITNASVEITVSGSAVDYNSIKTQNGFYRSSDRTIVFSRDNDPALSTLAPGASGVGAFSFSTLPSSALAPSPTIVFTVSVSGTRVGQTNVPEQVSASISRTAKVSTTVELSASSLHSSGPLASSGPVPPRTDTLTTYTVLWNVQNKGSTVAGGVVSTTLPGYVSYTGTTAGAGSFSYDPLARTVSWTTGDLAQGAFAQGAFQVSITPSSSQKGNAPALTGGATFSGYDRFAGVPVTASADAVTTDPRGDPGSVAGNGLVQ